MTISKATFKGVDIDQWAQEVAHSKVDTPAPSKAASKGINIAQWSLGVAEQSADQAPGELSHTVRKRRADEGVFAALPQRGEPEKSARTAVPAVATATTRSETGVQRLLALSPEVRQTQASQAQSEQYRFSKNCTETQRDALADGCLKIALSPKRSKQQAALRGWLSVQHARLGAPNAPGTDAVASLEHHVRDGYLQRRSRGLLGWLFALALSVAKRRTADHARARYHSL